MRYIDNLLVCGVMITLEKAIAVKEATLDELTATGFRA